MLRRVSLPWRVEDGDLATERIDELVVRYQPRPQSSAVDDEIDFLVLQHFTDVVERS